MCVSCLAGWLVGWRRSLVAGVHEHTLSRRGVQGRIAHIRGELGEGVVEAVGLAVAGWRHIAVLERLHVSVGMSVCLHRRFVLKKEHLVKYMLS